MRAVVVPQFGGPEVLEIADVPEPEPGPGQVRIRVRSAAVNPVDLVTRAGILAAAGLHTTAGVGLGWDVAGTVEAVGAGVLRLRPGQPGIGLSVRLQQPLKAQADAVVLDENAFAAVPGIVDPDVAATLPLAGLTALQALDVLDLPPGTSVLVTGAGGAVGQLAVGLARLRGLRVIGAGRPVHERAIRSAGADAFVDADDDVATAVRRLVAGGVDGAIDAAGLGAPALDAVRDGGSHVSLVVLDRPAPLRGTRSVSIAVRADWQQLTLLAALAATGALPVSPIAALPLDAVREAHDPSGHRGRIVLRP